MLGYIKDHLAHLRVSSGKSGREKASKCSPPIQLHKNIIYLIGNTYYT